jgi:hypothetical protein
MPADIDNLLTPQQATALLGKSRCQVWRYGRDGTLRSVVLAGKRFYFRDDVLKLKNSRREPQLTSKLRGNLRMVRPPSPVHRAHYAASELEAPAFFSGFVRQQVCAVTASAFAEDAYGPCDSQHDLLWFECPPDHRLPPFSYSPV